MSPQCYSWNLLNTSWHSMLFSNIHNMSPQCCSWSLAVTKWHLKFCPIYIHVPTMVYSWSLVITQWLSKLLTDVHKYPHNVTVEIYLLPLDIQCCFLIYINVLTMLQLKFSHYLMTFKVVILKCPDNVTVKVLPLLNGF